MSDTWELYDRHGWKVVVLEEDLHSRRMRRLKCALQLLGLWRPSMADGRSIARLFSLWFLSNRWSSLNLLYLSA